MRFLVLLLVSVAPSLEAVDWPMWRGDSARTASTTQELRNDLSLKWTRELPPLEPAYQDQRLQFDAGYEPIAFGNRIFLSSSCDNSVTAFDSETGTRIWKFHTDGPVRFAPVAGNGRVIFGSDDGWVYCVGAAKGNLVWKQKAVPRERKLIGNGHLISVWPIRGGPVLHDEKVYFAAGVWPLEGVFVYCLEAATGKVVWLNDSSSYIYGQHPHDTEAFGGLAPQGYLLVDDRDLVVPSSNAYPARFDLATGKLKEFQLPAPGRLPGGWFAARLPAREARRGKVVFDSSVNQKRHEDRLRKHGNNGVRNRITFLGEDFVFSNGYREVDGEINSAIAADGNLIISTLEGRLYCFGETEAKPVRHPAPESRGRDEPTEKVARLLQKIGKRKGYAVLFSNDAATAETLAVHSQLRVISVQPEKVSNRRSNLSTLKFTYRTGSVSDFEIPPYFADLVLIEPGTISDSTGFHLLATIYHSVRPFGGMLVIPKSLQNHLSKEWFPGAQINTDDPDYLFIQRSGSLKGTTNYLGDWKKSPDSLVKAPLGVLWFGDQTSNFKRAPQPKFVNGVMISVDKDWTDASTRNGKVDYRLLAPKFTDVYTGRPFESDEVPELRQSFSNVNRKKIQPSQYRPPSQLLPWKPKAPRAGHRINPLTGKKEPRTFPKMYGCDGGLDYGNLYTMRSGTAAFYDLQSDSGTINISGPRSGCTNSIIPANGVLNVPYFYEGCTCSYPLPMGLSLTSMPESFEQWMSWGTIPVEELSGKIQRIGINFGAPGDRKTEDGTLWLDYPDRGGPSPQISIKTEPANPLFHYRHSLWMKPVNGTWPWVAASTAEAVKSVTVEGFKKGTYQVKLTFAKMNRQSIIPDTVSMQGNSNPIELEQNLELMESTTKAFSPINIEGKLSIHFPVLSTLSGIEVIPAQSD